MERINDNDVATGSNSILFGMCILLVYRIPGGMGGDGFGGPG
jgi:hypothetical protein